MAPEVEVDRLVDELVRQTATLQQLVAEARAQKWARYFHDCSPGCKPDSLDPADHIPTQPDQGPTCRVLYRKALRWMKAGTVYPERGFIAANRIGKTDTAAYEVVCHLTGHYPPWWEGRRWHRPTDWRAAGDTMLTTRDILQKALLGPHEGVPVKEWSGMIPAQLVVEVTRRSGGITNCVDTIHVRHVSGGVSRLSFLSYDMGRRVFQGFECDGFWIDEEPPDASEKAEASAAGSGDIYGECLLRTMTTNGIVLATFTPLRGWTIFMRGYFAAAMMPGTEEDEPDVPAKSAVTSSVEGAAAVDEDDFAVQSDKVVVAQAENPYGVVQPRFIIGATWDDAPHLTPAVKAQQWASMLPYQRAARTKGIPQLGAGAVYPIDEQDLSVADFVIPEHWWRGFGMDVGGGAKATAAVFAALNPDDRVLYITSVYKRASNEPSLHAAAIKERMMRPTGWLWPGVGDAAALIMTEHDAEQLVYVYRRLGLPLFLPDKAVETGISDTWDLMVTGRLKVFKSCQAWWDEFRMYRRDARGRVVKSNDHLMDSCLTAESAVITRDGVRPIGALVGVPGWVLTRGGAWAWSLGARKTRVDVPVVRVTFEDGHAVTCTPDHPFLTPDGWRRADRMAGRDCYDAATQREQTAWHFDVRRRIRSFKDAVTTSVASIFSAVGSVCTARFGKPRMGPFRTAGMCTIVTTTGPTMRSKIWNSSREADTSATITAATAGRSLPTRWSPPCSGISLRTVARGTVSTTVRWAPPSFTPRPTTSVSSVARTSWPVPGGSSAPTPVRRGFASRAGWTMWNAAAWCVATALWRIATRAHRPARDAARRRCLTVVPAGTADVYCLTVPGPSSFCLANGAVVHNTRYLCRSGIARMKRRPAKTDDQTNRVLLFDREAVNLGWMGS